MSCCKRGKLIVLCAFFAFASNSILAQNSSIHTISTDKNTLTFIPHPDIGFVYQPDGTQIKAFNSMLSSLQTTIESREIRGLNKSNFSNTK